MNRPIFNLRRRDVFRSISGIVLAFTLAAMHGCAGSDGGTSGTGGGGFGVSGTLRTASNAPVSGVVVSVVQPAGVMRVSERVPADTGQSGEVVTNDQGSFYLNLDQTPATLTLLFQAPTFDSTVDIPGIPSQAAMMNINLLYDAATESVERESETFEDETGEAVGSETQQQERSEGR